MSEDSKLVSYANNLFKKYMQGLVVFEPLPKVDKEASINVYLHALSEARYALKFYENAKRLMIDVRDVPDGLLEQHHMDNGDVARATLDKIDKIISGEVK